MKTPAACRVAGTPPEKMMGCGTGTQMGRVTLTKRPHKRQIPCGAPVGWQENHLTGRQATTWQRRRGIHPEERRGISNSAGKPWLRRRRIASTLAESGNQLASHLGGAIQPHRRRLASAITTSCCKFDQRAQHRGCMRSPRKTLAGYNSSKVVRHKAHPAIAISAAAGSGGVHVWVARDLANKNCACSRNSAVWNPGAGV